MEFCSQGGAVQPQPLPHAPWETLSHGCCPTRSGPEGSRILVLPRAGARPLQAAEPGDIHFLSGAATMESPNVALEGSLEGEGLTCPS